MPNRQLTISLLTISPLTRPPTLLRLPFPGTEWQGAPVGPSGRPRLYLTFDDGPNPEHTPWVLEQLAGAGARGTFFCVGDNLLRHPEVARVALAAGHCLGNHTQHHQSAWAVSRETYVAGVAECQELVSGFSLLVPGSANDRQRVTRNQEPETSNLFRPPYGRLTWPVLRALRAQGYRVIMWSVLTRDYDATLPPDKALRLTLAATRPGDILVLHDSHKASGLLRFLLPRLLAHYGALGYEFAAL